MGSSHGSSLNWSPVLRLGRLSRLYPTAIEILGSEEHNTGVIYRVELILGERRRHLLRESLGEVIYV